MTILPSAFYRRPTLTVARELIGKVFIRRLDDRLLRGRIVEVEAYHQNDDAASHSFRGRSARNDVMFRAGGLLYVYFTYGMHFCMNVVTEDEGVGAAVLLRAVEPLDGIDMMRVHRGAGKKDRELANGPAKFCQAFGIDREANGFPLDGSVVGIADAADVPSSRILATSRVGIRRSTDLPWRFLEKESPWVSPGRPSAIL